MPDVAETPVTPAAAAPADPAAPAPPAPGEGEGSSPKPDAADPAAAGAAGAQPKKDPASAPAPKRRFKVKVEGEEAEVDEDELVRSYQLSRTAYQRLEQVAQLRKQLEGLQHALRTDPVATLRRLAGEQEGGPAFRQAVEKWLYDEMTREKMDPKERALAEAQEKLRQAEEEKKTWAQQQREAKLAEQQAYWQKKYDDDITAALADPEVGLPKTPAVVRRMAELMAKSIRANIPVEARDVAKLVRDELLGAQRELLAKLDGASLVKYLGQDVAKRIRSYEVEQLKARGAPAAVIAHFEGKQPERQQAPAPKPPEERRPITPREFDEYLKSIR